MDFAAGDKVVHPQHGMATVQGVLSKDLGAGPVDYVELYVTSGAMKIMVPAASVDVHVRAVSSKADAEAILAVLEDGCDVPERWAERNVSTSMRMKSGDLTQIAGVARDLTHHARRTGKPLSLSEKSALDRCLGLLSSELSLSLGVSQDEVLTLVAERIASVPSTSASVEA